MKLRLTSILVLALACATTAHGGPEWVEGTADGQDAGSISNDAQRPIGFGSLVALTGQVEGVGAGAQSAMQGNEFDDFEDMFLIQIDDPENFRVTTVPELQDGAFANFDTCLWLLKVVEDDFQEGGIIPAFGIFGNDNTLINAPGDGGLFGQIEVTGSTLTNASTDKTRIVLGPNDAGRYLLAITQAPNVAVNDQGVNLYDLGDGIENSGPDGPAGEDPHGGWSFDFLGAGAGGKRGPGNTNGDKGGPPPGSYTIMLEGVVFPPPFGACCFGPTLGCNELFEDECDDLGGQFLGEGSECMPLVEVFDEDLDLPIPTNDPVGVSHTISVAEGGKILDVDAGVLIEHDYVADLTIKLEHDGVEVVLWDQQCGVGAGGLLVSFDDEGDPGCPDSGTGMVQPASVGGGMLAAFDGLAAAGDWTFTVIDDVQDGVGTILVLGISLTLDPCGVICGDLDGDLDVDLDDLTLMLAALGSEIGDANYDPNADFDDDGVIGFVDYGIWFECYQIFNGV